jgi:hypothetical protein
MSYTTLDAVIARLQELRAEIGNATCLTDEGYQLGIVHATDCRFLNDVAGDWQLDVNDLKNGIILICAD